MWQINRHNHTYHHLRNGESGVSLKAEVAIMMVSITCAVIVDHADSQVLLNRSCVYAMAVTHYISCCKIDICAAYRKQLASKYGLLARLQRLAAP